MDWEGGGCRYLVRGCDIGGVRSRTLAFLAVECGLFVVGASWKEGDRTKARHEGPIRILLYQWLAIGYLFRCL